MPAAPMKSADYTLNRIPIKIDRYLKQTEQHHKEVTWCCITRNTHTSYEKNQTSARQTNANMLEY